MNLPHRINEPGPLLNYIARIQTTHPDLARQATNAVKRLMETDDGAIFLELLHKATVDLAVGTTADLRALENLNAQSFILHDLRRIIHGETDQVRPEASRPSRRTGRG